MLSTLDTSPAPSRRTVSALWAVLILALGHTLLDIYVTTITPLMPHFVQAWDLSPVSLGLLSAAMALTGSLVQPLMGLYLDRRATSGLAAIGVLWTAVTVVVLQWMQTFPALFILATVTVLGSALYHPLGATLARHVAPPNRRGLYMSLFMNIGNLGWASAPMLVTYMYTARGLSSLAWLAVPGVLVTLALFSLGLSTSGSSAQASDSRPEPTPSETAKTPAVSVSRSVRHRGVIFLIAVTLLRSWVASAIQTYLPIYLVDLGHSLETAGSMLTLFILAGTLSGFAFGYLSDAWGPRNLLAASLLVSGASWLAFMYAPAGWLGVTMISVTGIALLGSLPLTVVLVQEMLPNHAGTGSGLIMGFSGGVGGLLVLASGYFASLIGLRVALEWLVPVLPVAAVLALMIPEALCRPAPTPAAFKSESATVA